MQIRPAFVEIAAFKLVDHLNAFMSGYGLQIVALL